MKESSVSVWEKSEGPQNLSFVSYAKNLVLSPKASSHLESLQLEYPVNSLMSQETIDKEINNFESRVTKQ